MTIKLIIYNVKAFVKSISRWFSLWSLAKNDVDFDSSPLYEYEYFKICKMYDYFKDSHIAIENKRTASDLLLCKKLLEIIISYNNDADKISLPYVNTKNSERFTHWHPKENTWAYNMFLEEVRANKAINLYYTIRAHSTASWWD